MKETHVACGQFKTKAGDKEYNLSLIEKQTAVAAGRGCHIIVFPEMCLSGYLPPEELREQVEGIEDRSIGIIRKTAATHSIIVVAGFAELDHDTGLKHNTFAVIGSSGEVLGRYRKVHLWDTEARWAAPGNDILAVDTGQVILSGWICYDTRFPEMGRLCAFKGAELCVVPTAWLGPPDGWELSLRARGLDNLCFTAGSDLINDLPGLECGGHSLITDPYGAVLARADPGTDCVIDAILNPESLESQKTRIPLLRDRRPELYSEITAPYRPLKDQD